MPTGDIGALVAAAEEALANQSDVGGESAVVAGIPCMRLPVDQPWAVQARAMSEPTAAALAAAMAWLRDRHASGGTVVTRVALADRPVFVAAGLETGLVLGAMVRAAEPEPLLQIPGLVVDAAPSVAEFRAVYDAFGDGLAPLATVAHLAAPSYLHLVGSLAGEPVACARVRWAAGTAHVFGVAVLPEHRNRGLGTAISAAATRAAERGGTGGPVWLHAAEHLRPLYERLGYRHVDDHVQLRLRD